MPEYSSTTITPADGVQVPSMNGSTSGNFLLSALRDYILASKGQANGLASLGSDGKLTASQLPDLADDVIVVASYAVLPATGTAGKIYITADNNKMYRWDSDLSTPDYVELSVDLSEYAKLTDLAAEESARETADANLNDAITQLDHRVQNIEQSKGDYVVQNYKDGSITPSGKGNWAVVEGLRGVSRVENNVANPAKNNSSVVGAGEINGITVTYDSTTKKYHVQGTASADFDKIILLSDSFTSGHGFMLYATNIPTGNSGNVRIYYYGSAFSSTFWNGEVKTAQPSGVASLYLFIANGTSVNFDFQLITTDLSVYFGGSIPADADTFAHIQQNYPHLLTPSEYGVRIVDSSYSGVRAWGVNLFNPYATQTTTYGTATISDNGDTISITGTYYCLFALSLPVGAYHVRWTAGSGSIHLFRFQFEDGSISDSQGNNTTLTVTKRITGLLLYCASGTSATSVYSDVQIAYDDSPAKTTYHRYREPSTLSLTFQGKSAGSVSEMYYPETGEVTHPIGSYTFDGTESWEERSTSGGAYYMYWNGLASTIKAVASSSDLGDILSADYVRNSQANIYAGANGIAIGTDGSLRVYDPSYNTSSSASAFATHMTGKTIRYALAAPDPSTYVTPIIDNTLLTEAGGRMATVQTGTVVDGSFDLGFITL